MQSAFLQTFKPENYFCSASLSARAFSSATSSSVSQAEVHKFSEFSKTWWDPRQNPLIGMNAVRVGYIVDQIRKVGSDGSAPQQSPPLHALKALDVGCGGGLLSESLARLGANVTAVDPSTELVKQAQQHAILDPKTQTIDYRGGCTVEELAREKFSHSSDDDGLYDVICLLEVIEHVTDIPAILNAAHSLLKPDTGRLFVSTMNRTVKSNLIAIIGAEYVMRYLPPGTHDWNQFRSPAEVQTLMNDAGLEQVDVQGMIITSPPIGGKWSWKLDPDDVDVNWIGAYKAKG